MGPPPKLNERGIINPFACFGNVVVIFGVMGSDIEPHIV
jgi:hypothetical protein